ncbi:helix-turn-helix transcriptional regulator [Winogradskya humida]|uniref:HTH luxR-type domain-containing protein n=1 Tax=Winogradskya humida TaxID=113566 RepID=A0ABQ4A7Q1_9ACTN|nr:helix-turn-helix transcriptional regulator [Actinoplanes humidus]GIE26891.1 hypothetical protein Ahu01nite_099930 [Actinoplanes humidus]
MDAKRASESVPQQTLDIYRTLRLREDEGVAAVLSSLDLTEGERTDAVTVLKQLSLLTERQQTGELVLVRPEAALLRVAHESETVYGELQSQLSDNFALVRRLVDDFMPLSVQDPSDTTIQVITDPHRLAVILDDFTEHTQREILSMHPGPLPSKAMVEDALPRSQMLAERGLRMRSIYLQRLISASYVLDNLRQLADLKYEIRIASLLPVRLIISDGRQAIIPVDPENGRAGGILISGTLFVRSLVRIFNYFWDSSSSFDEISKSQLSVDMSVEEQAVLRMLASGVKDEKIARSLGVSLRTVARIVADLMTRLEAESRFQAGVRAVQLGWL